MKNNCAENWRKVGWWCWNTLKQSLLTVCSTPCPVHTVLTNKGFQRKPPRKLKAVNLKKKKSTTARRTGLKEC